MGAGTLMVDPQTDVVGSLGGLPPVDRDTWIKDATCRSPAIAHLSWFPEAYHSVGSTAYELRKRRLDAICLACPVSDYCLEEALSWDDNEDVFGVRAGTNQRDRKKLRRLLR